MHRRVRSIMNQPSGTKGKVEYRISVPQLSVASLSNGYGRYSVDSGSEHRKVTYDVSRSTELLNGVTSVHNRDLHSDTRDGAVKATDPFGKPTQYDHRISQNPDKRYTEKQLD